MEQGPKLKLERKMAVAAVQGNSQAATAAESENKDSDSEETVHC